MVCMRTRTHLLVFSFLFFLTVSAESENRQDSAPGDTTHHADDDVVELERMIVTASKTPMSADLIVEDVEVVTKEDSRRTGAFSAMELFEAIPGVDIDPARTQTQIVLNGMEGEYVKILVDGIPVTGNVGGGFPLENMTLGDIERVEVLSGGASTMYGTDAIGGVVNVITDQSTAPTPLGVKAAYSYLNNDNIGDWGGKHRIDLGLIHANSVMKTELFGGFDYDPGMSQLQVRQEQLILMFDYPEEKRRKVSAKVSFFPTDALSLRPSANYNRSGSIRSSGTAIQHYRTVYRSVNLPYTVTVRENWDVGGYASVRNMSHRRYTLRQGPGGGEDTQLTDFVDQEGEVRSHLRDILPFGGENHLILAGNAIKESIDSDNTRKGVDRLQGGLFTAVTWSSGTDMELVVNPSARVTLSENVGDGTADPRLADISPKLGTRLNNIGLENLYVTASYGQNFKVPRLKKMYYDFLMGDSFWIRGNDTLAPEKSHQYDLGAGYSIGRLKLASANAWYTDLRNKSVLVPVLDTAGIQVYVDPVTGEETGDPKDPPLKTYESARSAYVFGLRLKADVAFTKWFSAKMTFSHVLNRYEEDEGRWLEEANYAPNTFQTSFRWSLGYFHSLAPELNLTVLLHGRQISTYVNDTIPEYESGWAKLNLTAREDLLRGVSIYAGVNNVLGYVRNGHAGLNYGRTYFLSVGADIPDIREFSTEFFLNY